MGGVLFVASPMLRCLETSLPTIQALNLPRDCWICHGSAYELGAAGLDMPGLTQFETEQVYPCRCIGFTAKGWDYQGCSSLETKPEFLSRIQRFIRWIQQDAFLSQPLQDSSSAELPTLVLCMHLTILDLVMRSLVDHETLEDYNGEIKYKIHNSFFTELLRHADGSVSVLRHNSGEHLRTATQPILT